MKKRFCELLAAGIFTVAMSGTGQASSLIITGVIDGPLSGGTPKAVELYVLADIADLSLYGLGFANNGGGTDGQELALTGAAVAGEYIYIASESAEFANFFGFSPNYTGSKAIINGDDAIELFWNNAVVDVFGDINVNGTGQAWEYTDGWAYRKSGTAARTAFDLNDWFFSGVAALDTATANGTAAIPFPLRTYSPSPVSTPVPPAALLLGSALVGLVGVRRRRAKS